VESGLTILAVLTVRRDLTCRFGGIDQGDKAGVVAGIRVRRVRMPAHPGKAALTVTGRAAFAPLSAAASPASLWLFRTLTD
jgi:hypothetical protein